MNFKEAFARNPIIGVLRGIERKNCVDTIEAAIDGGVTCIEITMNTPDVLSLIKLASVNFKEKCCIGAGTVLTKEHCERSQDAGAQFIVTPNTQREIIERCKSADLSIISGALTPTEVYDTWKYGATCVKVFPVNCVGGHEYIRQLRGPFDQIPLIAFGGVTVDKIDDYFRAGVTGIGLGNQLFNPEWIKDGNYQKIKDCAEVFTKSIDKNGSKL